jgi:hypothetical protein
MADRTSFGWRRPSWPFCESDEKDAESVRLYFPEPLDYLGHRRLDRRLLLMGYEWRNVEDVKTLEGRSAGVQQRSCGTFRLDAVLGDSDDLFRGRRQFL